MRGSIASQILLVKGSLKKVLNWYYFVLLQTFLFINATVFQPDSTFKQGITVWTDQGLSLAELPEVAILPNLKGIFFVWSIQNISSICILEYSQRTEM